ncbi:phenylacetate--CoA ligase family protein [Alkalilimnicola sp. S0819]|uniref:phenylacetate--CoA ligase family protein n=1 Tax=Alkalilimnicola sp. S0819 TaxID=2613922 RepID=UPI0012627DA0|nr:AMP-binding protein [Alkalilimnicola sp. S0819]KAB7622798.1 phenylacetate--CoA ligase [Alkalilimnicola sp. S0819]MPQ17294.1 AMP-binding protein [Alkalilimnicola sp. S0819]
MEEWNYPPRYDNGYLPDRSSRYWFRERETMEPEKRDELIVARLREVMRYAYDRSPFYQRKWDGAGIKPEDIRSLEDFEHVPVVTKQELRDSQAAHPPFGDYLCCPESEIYHIHGTSGTTGRPTAFGISKSDWETIANNHARIMWGMGLRPGDTVMIAAILSLYMGSWGALMGAERLGCKAFPFGAGAPGMTARAVSWLQMMKPAGIYATPSYALRLAEVARAEGVDPRAFGLKVMFFSGEPGGSIPAIRDKIQDIFGAKVVDCGTMAELTPWMHASGSASTEGMLLWQDIVYTEVADPETHRRVPYGEQGTPIYTHLERTSQPMIRMVSGDLTHWVMEENPCGRTYPRLPKGIYGRIDDMFQIRGENVYPSAISEVLEGLQGYGGEHRIIISRSGSMDELAVQVEYDQAVAQSGADAAEALGKKASAELSRVLGVRAKVDMVGPSTFPRTDFKAQRVVDDRKLYDSLHDKNGG